MRKIGGRWILCGIVALSCAFAATLAPSSAGFAASATRAGPIAAADLRPQSSAVIEVQVICQRVRQGNQTITYSCPNGKTCVNAQGTWIVPAAGDLHVVHCLLQ